MVDISLAAVVPGEGDAFLTGIADLAIVPDPAGDILYAVTPDGGVASYRITADGLVAVDAESVPATPIAGIEAGIETISIAGTTQVVVTGTGGLWTLAAQPDGSLSDGAAASAAGGGLPSDLALVCEVALDGQAFVAGVCLGSERPGLWRVDPDGSLHQVAAPGAGQPGQAGVTALTALDLGGVTLVLGAAATSQALVAWRADAGGLTESGRIGAAEGLGLHLPSVVAAVEVGGTAYALLGAAGSGTLSVAEIGPDGALILRDHIFDSLDTRFQGISALETAVVNGRCFVFAAGADDGLSVLELLPGGRLLHHAALADTAGMTLANVSDLAVSLGGGGVLVTVASAAEPGLTLLDVALPQGVTLAAAAGGGALQGGAAGDLLLGGAGDDALSGFGGDDVLRDGAGSDTLTGGAGADTFVLDADGVLDTIADFDPALDRLDLSAWIFLRSADQLTVLERTDGAEIWFGDERLILVTASGQPLDPETVAALSLLSVDRLLPEWSDSLEPAPGVPAGETKTGSDSAEFMEGGAGADRIDGNGGADTLRGGDGADTLGGHDGDDILDGGGGDDTLDGGFGADTLIGGAGADTLSGGDGGDLLQGDDGNDLISGHGGQDSAEGGAGNDTLLGGAGSDRLSGGAGADLLEGKEGYDLLEGGDGADSLTGNGGLDTLDGGAGDDTLNGGEGADTLLGGEGADVLEGKAGADLLEGGAGADTLTGGDGHDTLSGGGGDDWLTGSPGADLLEGGDGADLLEGKDNYDTLRGGEGADTLWGGNGHDTLDGGGGDDSLLGGPGGDLLDGGEGADWLDGREGADTLSGDSGADTLYGFAGDDRLDGGGGNDWLDGGAGADVFVFTGGADTIADFAAGDRLELSADLWAGAPPKASAVLAGAEVAAGALILDLGGGASLTLLGVTDPDLLSGALSIL